jgi:hypothetical protein
LSETSFGSLFVRYEDFYRSLNLLIAEVDGALDLDASIALLKTKHPELELSESELRAALRETAAAAGVPLRSDGDGS